MNTGLSKKRRLRLLALEKWIRESEGITFDELLKICKVEKRMLSNDIEFLRKTGLDHGPINIICEHQKYFIAATGKNWQYMDMAEKEKATLPLVFSLLQPYSKIPSIAKVLQLLTDEYKLKQKSVKELSMVISQKTPEMSGRFIEMLTMIMICISKQVACEFNYYKVGEYDRTSAKLVSIFPLQIRIYEGRYYLIGIEVGKEITEEYLRLFSLDRIHNNRVNYVLDENEDSISFNWTEMVQISGLPHYFDHCIGILRNWYVDKEPSLVYRWFKGWPASLIEAVPIHSSQKIIQRHNGAIRIQLNVYNNAELTNLFERYGENCWEG
jgi:predicted DNA-binding transcriptional regulator YafY